MQATSATTERRFDRSRFDELTKARGARTIEQRAEIAGIGRQYLHKIYAGKARPSLATVTKIADRLDVAIDDIYPRAAA